MMGDARHHAKRHPAHIPLDSLSEESQRSYLAHMDRARTRYPQLARSQSYREGVKRRLLDHDQGKPWVDPY